MTANSESLDELSIDEISGDIIKRELLKVVKQQLGSENAELSIEPACKKGDNFMGDIYRIRFKSSDDKDSSNQQALILKIAPRNQIRRQKIPVHNLFMREIFMYNEVLTFFNNFQLSKGIDPKVNGFNECAKCYSSLSEELSESLFLEDLRLRQFDTINCREESVSFEHVSLMMKALGKFHAISFAVKDQQPDKFKQLSSPLIEHFWIIFEKERKYIYKQLVNNLLKYLEEENRLDLLNKFKQAVGDDPIAAVYRVVSSALAEPYAVICHGDATTNNTMFRKDNQGKPVEVQLFDWQFCRYASPVTELVLYLHCSTTKELRDKHYDELLRIYHDSLSDLLTRLGSNPQKLFPYEALLEQFRVFGIYSALVGATLLPMMYADIESMPNIDEHISKPDDATNEIPFTYKNSSNGVYSKRVTDLFDDLARFGYI